MDPSLFCFSASSDEEGCNLTRIRKQIRIRSDPLTLADSRICKAISTNERSLQLCSKRNTTSVPPKIQLAAALPLLASGGFQHNVGNDFIIGLSQSAISKLIRKFIVEVETKLRPKFITFCARESDECKEYFLRKYKIPGVIGCVDEHTFDCRGQKKKRKCFVNRKTLFHSLSSMIICDHEYKILVIN